MLLLVPWGFLYTKDLRLIKDPHFMQSGWPERWVLLPIQTGVHTYTLWVTRHTLCALYMADTSLRAVGSAMAKPRPHLTAPATNRHREDKHTHHQKKTYDWALHKKETNLVSKDFKVLREGQIRLWYGKDTWGQLGQEILFFGMGTIFNKQKRGRTEYK